MPDYSQDELDRLITLAKVIKEPPRRNWVEDRGHERKDFTVKAAAGPEEFSVFIRRNIRFKDNFSVGLKYHPPTGGRELVLIRCNGPHGLFNRTDPNHPHFHFHVHRIDAELLEAGEDGLGRASRSTEYASCEQAIAFFCRKVGIAGFEDYFPVAEVLDLIENPDGEKP